MKKLTTLLICTTVAIAALADTAAPAPAVNTSLFTIDASHPIGTVSPILYGLMTEEINHSYDGGLYAELVRNRVFKDDPTMPVAWTVVNGNGSASSIALDSTNSLNDKLTTSLRLTVSMATPQHPAGVANSGYWGIPVMSKTEYHASLYARAESGFTGPVTLSIMSDNGKTNYASAEFSGLSTGWKCFNLTLKTKKVVPTDKARLDITYKQPGTIWLGMVSLFPPTWNNQPNGFRKDLMQMLVDLNPKFLRFPGGNYVEGDQIATRFEWKNTIGPIEQRPGHPCPWGYRSSDGLGLLEFLEWCEDMHADPVLAVYAGYSLKGVHVNPGPDLEPYVQDALDEIEYVTGDTNTTWGARRAKDGHPAPFKLTYVEIGNEDWFDRARTYDERFTQFSDAIKAKYPQLKTIATIGNDQPENIHVHSRKPDMTDEHYYRATEEFLKSSPTYAQKYDRSGPEIFVGEWAAHEDPKIKPWEPGARKQPPTPSMKAAIGDGVFMAAMERNSDLIKMQCYAPLFVNVNPGARQWRPDLIGYNAISAYGSPSYYAIQMFSRNLGDEILGTATPESNAHETSLQGCATRDSKTGEIFIKLVNPLTTPANVKITIAGTHSLSSKGTAITLSAKPDDTNSIDEPKKVMPVTTTVHGIKSDFTYTMPAYSVVVLKLKAQP